MVMDAFAERLFDVPFDRGGRLAAKGAVLEDVVRQLLRRSFFRQPPPKTAGREQFGPDYMAGLLRLCGKADPHDIVSTATALTARSIALAVRDIVLPLDAANVAEGSRWPSRYRELVVSGGGTRNATLMRMIREGLAPLKLRVRTSDDFGLPSEAKEAVAFALLAYQTWRRLPSNVPSATGAKHSAILGKISYA
jgi:anhydro-N-acetylmuramic acid kinase